MPLNNLSERGEQENDLNPLAEQLFQTDPLREDIYCSGKIHIYSEIYDRSKPVWIHFAGAGMPQHGAGTLTSRSGFNIISITCAGSDWYQYPDVPAAKSTLAAAIRSFPAVYILGASMGAYGALHWSGELAPKAVMAYSPQAFIGPDRPDGDDRWDDSRVRIEAGYGFPHDDLGRNLCRKARLIVAYDPHDMDARHVQAIEAIRPVDHFRFPFAGHATIGVVARAGMVTAIMRDIMEDRIDVRRWQRTLRSRPTDGSRIINILKHREQRRRPAPPALIRALNRSTLPTAWSGIVPLMRAAMRARLGDQAVQLALRILDQDSFIRSDAYVRDITRLAPFLEAEGRSRSFARRLLDLAGTISPPRADGEEETLIAEIAREMGQERGHAVRMGRALAQARFRKRRSNLLLAAAQILVTAGYREEALGPALAVNTTLTVWDNSNAMAGRLLLTLGRPDEAAAAARRAIAFDPSDYAAHRILGEIHEQAGEWTGSVEVWRAAIVRGADRARSTYNLVRALLRAGRPAEALDAAADDGSPGLDRLRAQCQQRLGEFGSAAEIYRKLLAAAPGDGSLHHGLGECLAQLGLLDEAQAAARAAVALAPQQPRFARQLAAIERRMAQRERPAGKAPGR